MLSLASLRMRAADVFVTEVVEADWHQALTRSLFNKVCFPHHQNLISVTCLNQLKYKTCQTLKIFKESCHSLLIRASFGVIICLVLHAFCLLHENIWYLKLSQLTWRSGASSRAAFGNS